MMISLRALALVAAALVAACAAEPQAAGATAPREAIEYRTGSHIPVRQAKPERAGDRERPAAEDHGNGSVKPVN
jgi:hypothetical protein